MGDIYICLMTLSFRGTSEIMLGAPGEGFWEMEESNELYIGERRRRSYLVATYRNYNANGACVPAYGREISKKIEPTKCLREGGGMHR